MNQNDLILTDLQSGARITAMDALNDYSCFRLASRISELRKDGHDIRKKMILTITNKSIAQYYLEK